MSWLGYAAKRTAVSALVLLGASVLIFAIVRLVPGDPALIILGQFAQEGSLEALRAQLGLDVPVWKQYFIWITDILRFDWGNSLINGKPVLEMIAIRFPRSLELAVASLVFALVIAFPLGILGSINRNSPIDYLALFFSQVGVSMPSFWLGILFILLFGKYLNVLPPSGYVSPAESIVGNLKHLIMPALALGIINASVFTRYIRSEMLEELNSDYVKTARAYGHPSRRVIWKYVLRNAMIPTLTVIGIQFGYLIGGIVIIEQVFAYPGIGQLILDGLLNRDYPVIQLGLLVMATTFIVANLVVDLLYGLLDPKIRY